MGDSSAASDNPFAAYKLAEALTYEQLAARLGISVSYAKKLGSGHAGVSPGFADRFHRRTRGGLEYTAVMQWVRQMQARRGVGEGKRAATSIGAETGGRPQGSAREP